MPSEQQLHDLVEACAIPGATTTVRHDDDLVVIEIDNDELTVTVTLARHYELSAERIEALGARVRERYRSPAA